MAKVQRSYRYHTKWLIPEATAIKAKEQETEAGKIETILIWQEAYRSSHYFREGETVYHIDDLDTPLRVDKILRAYPKPLNGEKQKSKIIGVQVHWHELQIEDKYV